MLEISESGGATILLVKIVPGASRTKYLGEWQGRARIAVGAPPEKGKANKAVVEYVSKLLEINRRQVEVVAGLTNPLKTIRIEGVSADLVRAAFLPRRS